MDGLSRHIEQYTLQRVPHIVIAVRRTRSIYPFDTLPYGTL
jgi:hypothetical protein